MRVLPILLCLVVAAVVIGKVIALRYRESLIREHRFAIGVRTAEVRRSLGTPLRTITTERDGEAWYYPRVIVEFRRGEVIDSHALSPRQFTVAQPVTPLPKNGGWMWDSHRRALDAP